MTEKEKIALILAGISHRHEQYQTVKSMSEKTISDIRAETEFSKHFITTCRQISGWKRRKNEQ